MSELRIIAPLHNSSGYAQAGRALLRAALLAGFTVEAIEAESDLHAAVMQDGSIRRWRTPMFPDTPVPDCQREEIESAVTTRVAEGAPTILLQSPDNFACWPEAAGPRIGYTMTETDRLHPYWARACRNVNILLVPSRWCDETFSRDVPGVPVERLPLPVDGRLWSPDGPAYAMEDRPNFLFVSVFAPSERKHWRMMMQAIMEEFPGESVGLFAKTTRSQDVQNMALWCAARGNRFEVCQDVWTTEQLAALYRAADCFVLPSCEGFGLPFVEAALCGLPSVTLDVGGQADVVTEETGYLVPAHMEPALGHLCYVYRPDHRWSAPDMASLRATLRRAYEQERSGPGKGRAAMDAARRFTCSAIARQLPAIVKRGQSLYRAGPVPAPAVEPLPLACIVTTHNDLEHTRRCLAALRQYTPGARILVADDESTDGTREFVKQNFPEATLLECSGGNVAANRQVAVDALAADGWAGPIAYLDNDVEVGPGWWAGLAAVLAEQPGIGVLSPRKVYPDGTLQNTGRRVRHCGETYAIWLERRLVWPDYVESACMVVRPEVWQACRWDEQFPILYEDVDYCWQARAAGWDVACAGTVTVTHDAHRASSQRAGESHRNQVRFLRKWRDVL